MSEEQSAGELMVFGLIEQADRLAKSTSFTQATLSKQIEELVAMEARVNAAVQSIHGAVKNLEGERVKLEAERAQLKAIGPTLQQNAVWAMRETLREQAGQIKDEMRTEVKGALIEPLEDIQAGAGHVRQNVRETKWLTLMLILALGVALGLLFGYFPVRSGLLRLEMKVNDIEAYLAAQQPQPTTIATPGAASAQDHRKKASSRRQSVGVSQQGYGFGAQALGTRIVPRVPQTHSHRRRDMAGHAPSAHQINSLGFPILQFNSLALKV